MKTLILIALGVIALTTTASATNQNCSWKYINHKWKYVCQTPTPSPTTSPSSSVSPSTSPSPLVSPSSSPSPSPSEAEQPSPSGEPTASATPSPSDSSRPQSGGGSSSSASFPKCSVGWLRYVQPNDPSCQTPAPTAPPMGGLVKQASSVATGSDGVWIAFVIATIATVGYWIYAGRENE